MTTMCPMAAAVAPPPANRDSRTSTERPASDAASAHAAPTTPAPTTSTSGAGIAPETQASPEGIAGIEEERRAARDERSSLDARDQLRLALLEPAGEKAARDRLLAEALSDSQLSARVERGHFRRGSGAAGRSVVGAARAQDVVPAVRVRARGRPI